MIRKLRKEDQAAYFQMAQDFYSSDAVDHMLPRSHFENTFRELMRSEEYAQAFFLEYEGNVAGYALLAKSFSQEAGGVVVWIEELYIKPEYRSHGLCHEFYAFLKERLAGRVKRFRLEVEDSNQRAIALYRRLGFQNLPYGQMIQDF
ncbi:MAG: GNAT family N-acetyltransferase [Oscillospiraceae bacterium]|jgi:ribosomal protein S18 acetylase RimI-like enzyme|nr:GNAT family N-acetyltransferase [Oscillospiraceae bacterium]